MSTLAHGPGAAYKDGIFGSAMATGPGMAYKDGSLGSAMATGPGMAYRDGSLGSYYAYPVNGLGCSCGVGEDTAIQGSVSSRIVLGAALGAVALWFLQRQGIVQAPEPVNVPRR